MRLVGKVSLVTGSSRGIGRAIALALAREGSDVIVNYLKESTKADEVVSLIRDLGRKSIAIKSDVSDTSQINEMAAKIINEFGRIDILVNNAGITGDRMFHKMGKEDWQKVVDVNLTGVFNCTRAVLNFMRGHGNGRIVNISSVTGETGNVGQVNYAATKAGIIGFTKSLAREVANKGITVNAIAPGFIQTSMLDTIPGEIKNNLMGKIPLGRFGTPEDIAQAVIYLVSDSGNYITGQVINVNGGFYM